MSEHEIRAHIEAIELARDEGARIERLSCIKAICGRCAAGDEVTFTEARGWTHALEGWGHVIEDHPIPSAPCPAGPLWTRERKHRR